MSNATAPTYTLTLSGAAETGTIEIPGTEDIDFARIDGEFVATVFDFAASEDTAEWEAAADALLAEEGWTRVTDWTSDGCEVARTAAVEREQNARLEALGYDFDAFLGDFAETTGFEQKVAIARAAREINRLYPADEEARLAAFTAAVQLILGDVTLGEAGAEADAAAAAVRGAIIAAAELGTPEAVIARESGISRPTVRKILGK